MKEQEVKEEGRGQESVGVFIGEVCVEEAADCL